MQNYSMLRYSCLLLRGIKSFQSRKIPGVSMCSLLLAPTRVFQLLLKFLNEQQDGIFNLILDLSRLL